MLTGGKNLVQAGAALQAELTADAPVLCPLPGTPVLPWRIGMSRDLLAMAKDGRRSHVRSLIWSYTRRSSYLRALSEDGAQRHDIGGLPVEPVSEEHRARAAERLTERLAWKARARAARQRRAKRERGNAEATTNA